MKRFSKFLIICAFSIIPVLLIWLPFLLKIESFWNIPLPQTGLATIASNYDGPLYIVVSKTFYSAPKIQSNFAFTLPVEYYPAHFPLYPFLIYLLSFFTNSPYAMLIISNLSSIFALWYFYLLAKKIVKNESKALFLTFVFSIFPARWLIVRSVGSPEPLFVGLVLASLYYFLNKKYLLAGIFGGLAQFTKSPAILLFLALALYLLTSHISSIGNKKLNIWIKEFEFKSIFILLIPISLLGVFYIYYLTIGDFFAYFNSGDNIHLFFPPFQIFNYAAPWVNTHWLEEIILIYTIGAFGLINLIKQKQNALAWFYGIFFTSLLFVSHRDIIRYASPIVPLLLISFEKIINTKEFKFVLALVIIPIYLFSLAFISQNTMQISDWSSLL